MVIIIFTLNMTRYGVRSNLFFKKYESFARRHPQMHDTRQKRVAACSEKQSTAVVSENGSQKEKKTLLSPPRSFFVLKMVRRR